MKQTEKNIHEKWKVLLSEAEHTALTAPHRFCDKAFALLLLHAGGEKYFFFQITLQNCPSVRWNLHTRKWSPQQLLGQRKLHFPFRFNEILAQESITLWLFVSYGWDTQMRFFPVLQHLLEASGIQNQPYSKGTKHQSPLLTFSQVKHQMPSTENAYTHTRAKPAFWSTNISINVNYLMTQHSNPVINPTCETGHKGNYTQKLIRSSYS